MGCSADSVAQIEWCTGFGGTHAPYWHLGGGDPPFYKTRPCACMSWPEKICLVLQEQFKKHPVFSMEKAT